MAYSSDTVVLNINKGTKDKDVVKELRIPISLHAKPPSLPLTGHAAEEIAPGAEPSLRQPTLHGLVWGAGGAVATAFGVALASWLLQKAAKGSREKKMTGRLVREIQELDDESNDITVASAKW